jgi:hypothetical protein
MDTSQVSSTGTTPQAAAPAAQTAPAHDSGFSFHSFLSAINPLQYLPVVGTIYRAVTGDVIPEPLKDGGSVVVSGLLGGPIGLMAAIGTTVLEKVTGVDPDKMLAAGLGTKPATPEAAAPAVDPVAAVVPAAPRSPLSASQLAAYGVTSDGAGGLKLGDLQGADVLNSLELARLAQASSAYAANQLPAAAASG